MNIDIRVTEDSIFGDHVPDNLDLQATIKEYIGLTKIKIVSLYPNAEVSVELSDNYSIRVDGQADHVEIGWIDLAMDEVWADQDWEVYA